MKYLIGVDFGGGSSKATLLAEDGTVAAENAVEYPTRYPAPGQVEQDPEDWYAATVKNVRALLEKSGVAPSDIAALSLDAATHTAVLCGEDFTPLRPAIYWTDTRSAAIAKDLRERYGERIFSLALSRPDPIWTLPQLIWVRENEPELFSRIRRVLFAKDFVRHRVTGDFLTDSIEAQGSMLWDNGAGRWSEFLCSLAGISPEVLPRVVRPTDLAGTVTAEAARELGLPEGLPVLTGMTDTAAEVFASGAVAPGNMTVKLATAGRICVITDRAYPSDYLINYSHISDGLWYPGTATKACASSLRWFRDTFGDGMDYPALDRLAEAAPAGADGLLYHPYLNGELTPYADPQLCASFTGFRAGHTKGHFVRAVMEGVALSLVDCLAALDSLGLPHDKKAALIGGGAKSPLWRQIVSDALGMELEVRRSGDSSLGSAMLAGVAAGVWNTPADAARACSVTVASVSPDPARGEIYARLFGRYKAIHDALAPVYRAPL